MTEKTENMKTMDTPERLDFCPSCGSEFNIQKNKQICIKCGYEKFLAPFIEIEDKIQLQKEMKIVEKPNVSINLLKENAKNTRRLIIEMLTNAKSGHPGSSLSSTEIVVALIFDELNWRYEQNFSKRDRFILSKGHACPLLYATLAEAGFIPKEEIKTFRKMGSRLQGHPVRSYMPEYINTTTGALGQGLSIGLGMARYFKQFKKDNRVYVILGDGELQEGQAWEALMCGGNCGLDNIVAIIDRNGAQNDGLVKDIMPLNPLDKKLESFGWNVITIDGHDFKQIKNALKTARETVGKPTIIIANTEKGRLGPGKVFINGAHVVKHVPEEDYIDAMNYLNKVD
jgi:transketolase